MKILRHRGFRKSTEFAFLPHFPSAALPQSFRTAGFLQRTCQLGNRSASRTCRIVKKTAQSLGTSKKVLPRFPSAALPQSFRTAGFFEARFVQLLSSALVENREIVVEAPNRVTPQFSVSMGFFIRRHIYIYIYIYIIYLFLSVYASNYFGLFFIFPA